MNAVLSAPVQAAVLRMVPPVVEDKHLSTRLKVRAFIQDILPDERRDFLCYLNGALTEPGQSEDVLKSWLRAVDHAAEAFAEYRQKGAR